MRFKLWLVFAVAAATVAVCERPAARRQRLEPRVPTCVCQPAGALPTRCVWRSAALRDDCWRTRGIVNEARIIEARLYLHAGRELGAAESTLNVSRALVAMRSRR